LFQSPYNDHQSPKAGYSSADSSQTTGGDTRKPLAYSYAFSTLLQDWINPPFQSFNF